MKRIKAACICQTIHFMLKEDTAHEEAVLLVKREVEQYKKRMEQNGTRYKIVEEMDSRWIGPHENNQAVQFKPGRQLPGLIEKRVAYGVNPADIGLHAFLMGGNNANGSCKTISWNRTDRNADESDTQSPVSFHFWSAPFITLSIRSLLPTPVTWAHMETRPIRLSFPLPWSRWPSRS